MLLPNGSIRFMVFGPHFEIAVEELNGHLVTGGPGGADATTVHVQLFFDK